MTGEKIMSTVKSASIEKGELCRICKKPITNAQPYELKNGFACGECIDKTTASFCQCYREYAQSNATAGQLKKNIAFRRDNRKRYDIFTPAPAYSRYTIDHLILVDMKNRLLALYPTKLYLQNAAGDIEKMFETKRCEIFRFDEIKGADVLEHLHSQERFIRITLNNDAPGFEQLVCLQRDAEGKENENMDAISEVIGLVLKSRR